VPWLRFTRSGDLQLIFPGDAQVLMGAAHW
jgi:hypothetical protein